MDPIVTVLLTTAAGALIGTIVGVLLMRRQLRPIITDEELAELKSGLKKSESSLAAATTNAEDLKKQIAQRDTTIQQAREELKQKQQQLDRVLAEAQEETNRRSAAERKVQELSTQTSLLTEQCTTLESGGRELNKQLAEKATQIVSLQNEVDSGKRHAQELSEQVTRVTAELTEAKSSKEQDNRYRNSLEAQLRAEQEQIQQLNAKIAELLSERAQFEVRLEAERQSAAKGMELLLMAQEKFSGVFKAAAVESQNGNGNKKTETSSEADAETVQKVAGTDEQRA
jgi:chromosome segregation ATPase